jgi:hypothetical protein
MKTTEYIEAPDCLFLPPVEWSLLEYYQSPDDNEKYGRLGYPHITLENDETYHYIPIEINSKVWKVIPGNRPVVSESKSV